LILATYFRLPFYLPFLPALRRITFDSGKGAINQLTYNTMEKIYYIGTIKQGNKVILQARTSVDYLSCEIHDYFGARVTTKKDLKNRKGLFLTFLQTDPKYSQKYANCKSITVD
jgi:hypothetical protein